MATSTYDEFLRVRDVQNFFLLLYARVSRTILVTLGTHALSKKKSFAAHPWVDRCATSTPSRRQRDG